MKTGAVECAVENERCCSILVLESYESSAMSHYADKHSKKPIHPKTCQAAHTAERKFELQEFALSNSEYSYQQVADTSKRLVNKDLSFPAPTTPAGLTLLRIQQSLSSTPPVAPTLCSIASDKMFQILCWWIVFHCLLQTWRILNTNVQSLWLLLETWLLATLYRCYR